MMSYLWILLLGSLLAASAKAQDDAAPTEEATTLETTEEPTAEADAAADSSEDPAADEETEATSEEISPTEEAESETTVDPDPTADLETTVEPESTTEPDSTTEAEEVTPAADADSAIEEILTTLVAIIEEEAAATPEPAAEAETEEPVKPEPEEEDKPAKTNATTPSPKKSGADPDAEDSEEEPTDPVVLIPPIKPDVAAPEVDADMGFNLEDALAEGPAVENPAQPGKSRSLEPGPQAAGATGDVDKPDAEESGSSSLAGILSAVVIAAVGGVAAYITYQKKMLCFKNRQEADPEAARKADAAEAQSDPQVLSNLLNSS